jgi:hypothetical protein
MTFCMTTGLLKTVILDRLQCWKKNKFWGCLVGILPFSWIPKSWTTLLAFHRLLKQPHWTNGLEDMEFCASAKLLKTELDSTTVGINKIPKTRWNWNFRFSEYHSIRKLSQLSDGPLNDSKQLAIYELRLWENGRVTEFGRNWADLTFQHKSGFWWNFAMTAPETSYKKKCR